jgi:hypothetical protein
VDLGKRGGNTVSACAKRPCRDVAGSSPDLCGFCTINLCRLSSELVVAAGFPNQMDILTYFNI